MEILDTQDEDPSRRIVVLTVSDSGKDLTACIQAGADGYFLRTWSPREFLKSIRRALEGQTVVDASMLAFLTTTLRAKMSSTLEERPTLTGREAEVLDLIAKGCTNKVIARRLDITEGTVKGHREASAQEARLPQPRRGRRLGRNSRRPPNERRRMTNEQRPQERISCGLCS